MKNLRIFSNALATALMATAGVACTSEADVDSLVASSDNIQFESVVQSLATRATTEIQSSQIASGVQVGVFVTTATDGDTEAAYDNVALTADGQGGLTGTTTMKWNADQYYFYAYAPYSADNTGKVSGNIAFAVNEDQSTDDNYKASDLLWGQPSTNPMTKTTDGKVALTFQHALSKVIVTLKDAASDANKLTAPTVALTNVVTSGTMATQTGEVTANAATSNVTVGSFTASSSSYEAAAVIVPQTVTSGVAFIQVTDNDKTYSCSLPADKEFAAGTVYKYTVTFNGNALSIELSTTLTDWTDGGSAELDPKESKSYGVGDFVLSDGSLVKSNEVGSSDNVVGVIFSTTVSEKDAAAGYNAYIMSLTKSTNVTPTTGTLTGFSDSYTCPTKLNESAADLDGLTNTQYLVNKSTTDYPGFNITGLTDLASLGNFSMWFVPSAGQMYQILNNLGNAGIDVENTSKSCYCVVPTRTEDNLSIQGITYAFGTAPTLTTLLATLKSNTNNVEVFATDDVFFVSTLYSSTADEGSSSSRFYLLSLKNAFNGQSDQYGDGWGFSAGNITGARSRVACAAAKLTLTE